MDFDAFYMYFGRAVVCKLRPDWTVVSSLPAKLMQHSSDSSTAFSLELFAPTELDVRLSAEKGKYGEGRS